MNSKIFQVIQAFGAAGRVPQAMDNRNVTPYFGKCFIEKGSDFNKAAWGTGCDLPFEFIWAWIPKDEDHLNTFEQLADIILCPADKDNAHTRIYIFAI